MIEIEGAGSIIAKLEKAANVDGVEKAIKKGCAIVERAAKQKAPKDTGELRRSIQSKVSTVGGNVVGVVFTPLEYAPYVEYGTGLFAENGGRKDVPWYYTDEKTGELIRTSGQKPHPYLRPAFNENREKILNMIKEGMNID